MKKLLGSLAFAAFVLGTAACGKNEVVKKAEDLADKACACKDADCATKVSKDWADMMQKAANAKGSDSDAKALAAASQKFSDCVTKAMGAGGGGDTGGK